MTSLWPWLAIAAAGALHGLNPLSGWMWAAGCAARSHNHAQAHRALVPIALGHAVSMTLAAAAVVFGLTMERSTLLFLAGGLLCLVVVARILGTHTHAGNAGLALCSFTASTAHGAGLMLVPTLMPLCTGITPAGEIDVQNALTWALAAVAVHTATMLAVTWAMAIGLCHGLGNSVRLLRYLKQRVRA